MKDSLRFLKGVHPGVVLERELRKRGIPKGRFALSVNTFPQILGDITKGRRNMNTPLALRIEHELDIEEGFFMTLQVFYEIEQEKRRQQSGEKPDLSKLRRVLFWDTKMENIDWQRQKRAVVERVYERGNEEEMAEINRFYGEEQVKKILNAKRNRGEA